MCSLSISSYQYTKNELPKPFLLCLYYNKSFLTKQKIKINSMLNKVSLANNGVWQRRSNSFTHLPYTSHLILSLSLSSFFFSKKRKSKNALGVWKVLKKSFLGKLSPPKGRGITPQTDKFHF
jgi:hypothetical protein